MRLKLPFSKAVSNYEIIILAVIPGGQTFSCTVLASPCYALSSLSASENQARNFDAQNTQLWKPTTMEIYTSTIFPKLTKSVPFFSPAKTHYFANVMPPQEAPGVLPLCCPVYTRCTTLNAELGISPSNLKPDNICRSNEMQCCGCKSTPKPI